MPWTNKTDRIFPCSFGPNSSVCKSIAGWSPCFDWLVISRNLRLNLRWFTSHSCESVRSVATSNITTAVLTSLYKAKLNIDIVFLHSNLKMFGPSVVTLYPKHGMYWLNPEVKCLSHEVSCNWSDNFSFSVLLVSASRKVCLKRVVFLYNLQAMLSFALSLYY